MEKLIGEIQKTATCKTMVRLTDFKGHELIDIRDYFKGQGMADYGPTKKGITIDISKVSDMISLIEKAEYAIKNRGAK